MSDVTTTLNEDRSRYEIHSGNTLAGYVEFERRPGAIRFVHTTVDPAFQGQGIAGQLAAFALRDAAAAGDALVPICPYIQKYLRRHEIPGAEVRWPQRPEAAGAAGSSGGR